MINIVKKLVSVLTTVCMLGGMAAFSVSAEETDSNKLVIASLNNDEEIAKVLTYSNKLNSSVSMYGSNGGLEETYNGAPAAYKIIASTSSKDVLYAESPQSDWSEYQWFRMRFYSSRPGMRLNICAYSTSNTYNRRVLITEASGWQEIAVPLKNDGTFGYGFQDSFNNSSWTDMSYIKFNIGGWSQDSWDTDDVMYIDEIWLEKDFDITPGSEAVNGTVLFDSNSTKSIGSTPTKSDYIALTNSRDGGNSGYAMQRVTTSALNWYLYQNTDQPIDIADKYLNCWMYSPEATNGGLQILVDDSNGGYGLFSVGALNWKGWKLISFDISKPTAKSGKGFDTENVTAVRVNANEWLNSTTKKGQHTPIWTASGMAGIEKIWISDSAETDTNQSILPETAEKVTLPYGNMLLKDFCSTEETTWIISGANARTYDTHARMEWSKKLKTTDSDGNTTYSGSAATKYIVPNTDSYIELGDYKYWNTWVYNPGVKTDVDGNTSKLVFNINDGEKNYPSFITMDWTGWKLVSIDIQSILSTSNTKKIKFISICANEWQSHSNNVLWSENWNYIDVERAWLSYEAPTEVFELAENGLNVANGAEDIPIGLGEYEITMNTEPDTRFLKGKVKVFAGTKELDENAYTVAADSKTITVSFNDRLVKNTKYTVRLDSSLTDVYGNLLGVSKTYSFITEKPPYEIESFAFAETGNSVSADITVYDNNAYSFGIILYESIGNKFVKCALARPSTDDTLLRASDGKVTLTAQLSDILAGSVLKAVIWDMNKLKPYTDAVVK